MTILELEQRLKRLEEEVERLKQERSTAPPPEPWWKKIVGVYKDDPAFDEAERLGREWRESFRPAVDEDSEVAQL